MGTDEKYTTVRQKLLKQLGITAEDFEYNKVAVKKDTSALPTIKKMLNREAKILLDDDKEKARKALLDIILKKGGMLDQVEGMAISGETQFKQICTELNSIKSGNDFLAKFVTNPNDAQKQRDRKDLKTALSNYFANANNGNSPQQYDATLVCLLLKELMAKDIDRLDNDAEIIYTRGYSPGLYDAYMRKARRFNNIISTSTNRQQEAIRQFKTITDTDKKTLKYYNISYIPKGEPEFKDNELITKTVEAACDLYLELLDNGGTEPELLEFTRYFVSTATIKRIDSKKIIPYFTPEDNDDLLKISKVLFASEPTKDITPDELEKLLHDYIETKLKPCAAKVTKQLQDIYEQFVKEIETEAANYKLSLDTKPLRSIPHRDRSLEIKNLNTPLKTFILNLYKDYSATATIETEQRKLGRLISSLGSMFYSSDLQYWNNDVTPYTGPDYKGFVNNCYNKIIEKCKLSEQIYQDASDSLRKFLKPYIDIDDSNIIRHVYLRSHDYIKGIYSSQFKDNKQQKIQQSYNRILKFITDNLEEFKTSNGKFVEPLIYFPTFS